MSSQTVTVGDYFFVIYKGLKWCSFVAYKNQELIQESAGFPIGELVQERFVAFTQQVDPLLALVSLPRIDGKDHLIDVHGGYI